MRKLCTLVSFATLAFSTAAFAQAAGDKPKAEPKPAAEKPAAAPAKPAAEKPAAKPGEAPAAGAPAMAAPKPPAEMDTFKDMIGTWRCEGKMTMGGKEMKDNTKASFAWDLDKFFVAGTFTGAKSKEMPVAYKGKSMMGWDPGSKMYTQMSADNMGGMSMSTSKGFEGETMTWTGKAKMMGMEMDSKETITKKGPKAVHLTGSMGSGPDAMTWESDCKK